MFVGILKSHFDSMCIFSAKALAEGETKKSCFI